MRHASLSKRHGSSLLLATFCCLTFIALWAANAPVASASTPTTGSLRGTITSVGDFGFTLKTRGEATHGVLSALTTAATKIGDEDLPYVWGGGHGVAGVASVGERGGPGYNGKRRGFDCSGSVAAALVAAGLWPRGTSVPADQGIIGDLLRDGLIAKGAGEGPHEVTLYDWPTVHIFMNIDGRFWGTTDGGSEGNTAGGPGWLTGYPYDAYNRHFKRYHFLSWVLKAKRIGRYYLGFQYPELGYSALDGFGLGNQVRVTYRTTALGTMVVQKAAAQHSYTANGVVDDYSMTTTAAGKPELSAVEITDTAGKLVTFTVEGNRFVSLTDGDLVRLKWVKQTPFGQTTSSDAAIKLELTKRVSTTPPTGTTTPPTGTTTPPTGTTTTGGSAT